MLDLSEGKNDVVIKTNEAIKKNISKIKNKLILIKENFILNEQENFDNIHCKINIYFTSLLNKIKIKYIEALNYYRNKIKQYERDILELMMDNMLLNIEINFLKEKKSLICDGNEKKEKNEYIICNLKKIKGKQKYQSQENINKFKGNNIVDNFIKINNQNPNKSRNNNNNININSKEKKGKSYNYNFNKINNHYNTYINELEENITKHRNAQSHLNIRKIKDEMDSIINKTNSIYNNNDNINIINEQITQNFFLKENLNNKYNKYSNNNISKNFINNTSINIFNTSNSVKKIKAKNNKIGKNNNKNILSLKTLYNNILTKKKVYNNTKLIKDKIKNLSRNKNNFLLSNNYSSNIGNSSINIYKTEYNENNIKYKKGDNKNKNMNLNINNILRNKSLSQIKLNKRNINIVNNNKIK